VLGSPVGLGAGFAVLDVRSGVGELTGEVVGVGAVHGLGEDEG
jgi:hypothetical protein